MLISEIGDVVAHHKKIEELERHIELAKDGKIVVYVGGTNLSEQLAEACQSSVISQLRAERAVHVRALMEFGFKE